jgi:hypothetical protein
MHRSGNKAEWGLSGIEIDLWGGRCYTFAAVPLLSGIVKFGGSTMLKLIIAAVFCIVFLSQAGNATEDVAAISFFRGKLGLGGDPDTDDTYINQVVVKYANPKSDPKATGQVFSVYTVGEVDSQLKNIKDELDNLKITQRAELNAVRDLLLKRITELPTDLAKGLRS